MAVAAAPTQRIPITLTLSTIGKVAFSDDPEKQIRFLQQRNLLATCKVCSCGTVKVFFSKSNNDSFAVANLTLLVDKKSIQYYKQLRRLMCLMFQQLIYISG